MHPTLDPNKALAELCRRRFYRFLREFIDTIEPNHASFVWNWHIEYLCSIVEAEVFKYINHKPTLPVNINICPGTSKSTIFSRALTAWLWTLDPSLTSINVTRSSSNLKNFGIACKQIIDSQKYKTLFPEIKVKASPDSVNYFQNENGGIRYGLTTNSKESTGKHGDVIVFDDAQSWTDMYSQKEIEQTERGVDGFLSREKRKGQALVFNVMQRLGKKDTTGYLFKGYGDKEKKYDDYIDICLPAQESALVNPQQLRSKYVDSLLDPVRLDNKTLDKEKMKFGSAKYEPQYNQFTETQEGLMYDNISWYAGSNKTNKDWIDAKTYRASFTDTADGGDYWCTVIFAIQDKKLYAVDLLFQKDDIEKSQDKAIAKLNSWKCHMNYVEVNKEQVTIRKMKKARIRGIKATWHNIQKTVRIESVAQFFKFIHWNKKKYNTNQQYKDFVDHLIKYPKTHQSEDGHDDAEDVVSMALNYFNIKHNYLFDEQD